MSSATTAPLRHYNYPRSFDGSGVFYVWSFNGHIVKVEIFACKNTTFTPSRQSIQSNPLLRLIGSLHVSHANLPSGERLSFDFSACSNFSIGVECAALVNRIGESYEKRVSSDCKYG